jgi:Transposase DDE domain
MIEPNIEYFKTKPVNILKITIMVDHRYDPAYLIREFEKIYPQIMTKIKFEVPPKPSKVEKEAEGVSGFVVIPIRWVMERSNDWMERCRSLIKNIDRTLENVNARIRVCFEFVRLMLRRLAAPS